MPQYCYVCPECKMEFTRVERIADRDDAKCACGEKANRVWTCAAVVFKGSGFYETDYKGKK